MKVFTLTFILIILGLIAVKSNAAPLDTPQTQYVTIGHHKLFMMQKGPAKARFAIVFEAGGGGSSRDWAKVMGLLPADIHAIAYDRAGYGKSEAGPLPRTMAQEVFELHELLKAAKVKRSIIFVGQSIGGLLARLYTKNYSKDVEGLVLVDPAHEDAMLGSMKYGGWVRIREKATGKTIPKPQIALATSPGYDSTADYMAEEFQNIYISGKSDLKKLANRPLIVIGAGIRKQPPGTPDDQWKMLRSERDSQVESLTGLSANSTFILDSTSSHEIQNDNPAIVVQAIQSVIKAVLLKTKL
jgi:pimeloyl-ACP methyl ester carboxylesterase